MTFRTVHSYARFFALAIALTTALCGAFPVRAQAPGFTVSPVKEFVSLKRGEAYRAPFMVVNRSDGPLPLEVTTRVFGVGDEKGSIAFEDAQGVAAEANPEAWLTLATPNFILAPNETRTVPFTIAVPADVPYGTYTIAAEFRSKLPGLREGTGALLLPGIGALFFIDVLPPAGEVMPEGTLRLLDFSMPREAVTRVSVLPAAVSAALGAEGALSFVERWPLRFTVRMENPGRYVARPEGEVVVRNLFGRTVARAPLPEGVVLPGTIRAFTVEVAAPERFSGSFLVPAFIRKSLFPGRYGAFVEIREKTPFSTETVSAKIGFWALPRVLILSTVSTLLILMFMLKWGKRFIPALKTLIWRR